MSYIPHFARVHGKKLFVTLTYFLSFEMRHDSEIQLPVYILYTEFLHTPMSPKVIIIIEVACFSFQDIVKEYGADTVRLFMLFKAS